jgi:hypothetical protein
MERGKSKANKNFTKQAGSWTPKSPQTGPEYYPAFPRVERLQRKESKNRESRPHLSPA